jgi:hypothetical protein
MLDRLDQLPAPQREALGVAFGLRSGVTGLFICPRVDDQRQR